jgi:hypothetical protein
MVCRAWGAPNVLQLENVPSRALRPGEVRIRVRAAGVNFADSLMVGGTYQVKPPIPFTPGRPADGLALILHHLADYAHGAHADHGGVSSFVTFLTSSTVAARESETQPLVG